MVIHIPLPGALEHIKRQKLEEACPKADARNTDSQRQGQLCIYKMFFLCLGEEEQEGLRNTPATSARQMTTAS